MNRKANLLGLSILFVLFTMAAAQTNSPNEASDLTLQQYGSFSDTAPVPIKPNYKLFDGSNFWFQELEDVAKQRFNCQIIVSTSAGRYLGSGTYIYDDGTVGAVLTCYHLFDKSYKDITVRIPGVGDFEATYLDGVPEHDIVLLLTDPLPVLPAPFTFDQKAGEHIFCGYPGGGDFEYTKGTYVGRTDRDDIDGRVSHTLDRGAVPGYSGGGIFNEDGVLTGVLWGSNYKKIRVGRLWSSPTKTIPGTETYFVSLSDEQLFLEGALAKVKALSNKNKQEYTFDLGHSMSLIMVSTPGCAACIQMKPVIDALAAEGYNASHVMLDEYNGPETPSVFPTLYIYRGSEKVFQHEGVIGKEILVSRLSI